MDWEGRGAKRRGAKRRWVVWFRDWKEVWFGRVSPREVAPDRQTFSLGAQVMSGGRVFAGWVCGDVCGQAGVGSGGIQGFPRMAARRVSMMLRPCFAAVERYPRMV